MSTNPNEENNTELTPPPAYFGKLIINNVKCFKGEHEIELSNGNEPAMWTVILGDNNTGKTTLLRCLANLEIEEVAFKYYIPKGIRRKNLLSENYSSHCEIFLKNKEKLIWSFARVNGHSTANTSEIRYKGIDLGSFILYSYGTSRRMSNTSLNSNTEKQDNAETLFNDNATLCNIEEWIIQIDYASKNHIDSAKLILNKIRNVFINGLLPNVKDFRCTSTLIDGRINNFVEVEIDSIWVKLRELGYGYQVTLAWVVDLAKKLFERYPNSENPLHEPAIVLIDEIDLHLHPEWQRKIVHFLRAQFPKTQFIATTHSPLIVQSADNINLVLLQKQDDHVIINQPNLKNYQGWTIEEILSELMGLEDKTKSDEYLKLMRQFDEALDEDNYNKAKTAYDALNKILHPTSSQRKLLRIQMSSLMPE